LPQLTDAGVLFSTGQAYPVRSNPAGTAHKPWVHPPWNFLGVSLGPRNFSHGMAQHASIAARMADGNVVAEPGAEPAPYKPTNLP